MKCDYWSDVNFIPYILGLVIARDGPFAFIYWPFFFGLGGNIGDGRQWYPWIHARDAAGIILHSITDSRVEGVLNVVAPDTVTNADLTYQLSRSMWRWAPFQIPGSLLKIVFGDERAEMMLKSPKIVPRRTLELGYKFVYEDLKSACQDCIKWGSY